MMARVNSKYKAKVVFWDASRGCVISSQEAIALREGKRNRLPPYIYRFDSTLEFNVYIKLLSIYPPEQIKRQVRVELIPRGKCYPKGKDWKIDFSVVCPRADTTLFYVEAKGRITPDFRNTLPILEHTNPDVFNNLILVFGSRIPIENRMVANLLGTRHGKNMHTLKTFNRIKDLL